MKTVNLCGGKNCCPTAAFSGNEIIIAEGDNVIRLGEEASTKLREVIVQDFLDWLIKEDDDTFLRLTKLKRNLLWDKYKEVKK